MIGIPLWIIVTIMFLIFAVWSLDDPWTGIFWFPTICFLYVCYWVIHLLIWGR